VTGHSLGGALATISSIHLMETLQPHEEDLVCVTCGSPRVGNSYFADLYSRCVPNSWRIVLSGDPVS